MWLRHKPATTQYQGPQLAWWGLLTTAVYCSGYLTVNLETRYIVPIAAPLLCLSAASFISSIDRRSVLSRGPRWIWNATTTVGAEWRLAATAVLAVLGFGIVDLYSIACVAIYHPQSTCMEQFRAIACQLDAAGIKDQLSASNRWHDGLYIAYARGNVSNYLGSPRGSNPIDAAEELVSSGVSLNFYWMEDDTSIMNRSLARTDRLTIVDPKAASIVTEVIIR